MSKAEKLKLELRRIGIHTELELKEAIKKTSIDISLMAAEQRADRVAS